MRLGMAALAATSTLLVAAADADATTMKYLSNWSASRTYEVGSVVLRNNELYYAVTRNRNSMPTRANQSWQLVGRVGSTIASGPGGPSAATGLQGDFWIDTTNHLLFGPKTATAWPATGTPLQGTRGATGPTGAQGAAGVAGPRGATGANGATGATGAAGVAGARGATGSNAAIVINRSYRLVGGGANPTVWSPVVLGSDFWTIASSTNNLSVGRYLFLGSVHVSVPPGTTITCALQDSGANFIGERAYSAFPTSAATTDIRQLTLMGDKVLTETMSVSLGCNGSPTTATTPPRMGTSTLFAIKLE